jgi:hypothetical protein
MISKDVNKREFNFDPGKHVHIAERPLPSRYCRTGVLSFANTRFSDLWISNTKRCPNSLKNRLPKISRSEQAVEPKGPAFRMSRGLC